MSNSIRKTASFNDLMSKITNKETSAKTAKSELFGKYVHRFGAVSQTTLASPSKTNITTKKSSFFKKLFSKTNKTDNNNIMLRSRPSSKSNLDKPSLNRSQSIITPKKGNNFVGKLFKKFKHHKNDKNKPVEVSSNFTLSADMPTLYSVQNNKQQMSNENQIYSINIPQHQQQQKNNDLDNMNYHKEMEKSYEFMREMTQETKLFNELFNKYVAKVSQQQNRRFLAVSILFAIILVAGLFIIPIVIENRQNDLLKTQQDSLIKRLYLTLYNETHFNSTINEHS
jgi:hypothetical protein